MPLLAELRLLIDRYAQGGDICSTSVLTVGKAAIRGHEASARGVGLSQRASESTSRDFGFGCLSPERDHNGARHVHRDSEDKRTGTEDARPPQRCATTSRSGCVKSRGSATFSCAQPYSNNSVRWRITPKRSAPESFPGIRRTADDPLGLVSAMCRIPEFDSPPIAGEEHHYVLLAAGRPQPNINPLLRAE